MQYRDVSFPPSFLCSESSHHVISEVSERCGGQHGNLTMWRHRRSSYQIHLDQGAPQPPLHLTTRTHRWYIEHRCLLPIAYFDNNIRIKTVIISEFIIRLGATTTMYYHLNLHKMLICLLAFWQHLDKQKQHKQNNSTAAKLFR